jgi:hypothetical protein
MTMTATAWFSVHVQARAPEGAPPALIDDAADRLMDLLAEHDGIVSSGAAQWDATIGLEEPDPVRAAAVAAALVASLAVKAGLPDWPTVRVEAVREDVLDEENARSTLPDLVSTPEAAEILGVTAQRLHELAARNREFPEAVYELKTGKLWLRDAIEAFAERWDRKPGRPDRAALIRQRVTSALLDAGITVAETKVFIGHERTVILQLEAHGGPQARRRAASKVIAALSSERLGVTDEASHSAADMEAHLAGGGTAEVFEISEEATGAASLSSSAEPGERVHQGHVRHRRGPALLKTNIARPQGVPVVGGDGQISADVDTSADEPDSTRVRRY